MSVVESKREEGKLKVITKARELEVYTVKICSNEKSFPKRYRWIVTNKIVDNVIDIVNFIEMANSIYVKTDNDKAMRRTYQMRARACTFSLLQMIDLAYKTFGIESGRVEYWTKMIHEVRRLLDNWIKADESRY